MSIKARHLIDTMAEMATLERAATDAVNALDRKDVWYVREFERAKNEKLSELRDMIVSGEYPHKEYKPRCHHDASGNKDREICPLPFYPWSILFHAVKLVLEPIAERVLIYDSSAGRKGKGQIFGALRTKGMLRRHKGLRYFAKSDLRKFYQSIPHDVVIDILGRYIDDGKFIQMFKDTVLDYMSDIGDVLEEERKRKIMYCKWADCTDIEHCRDNRGIAIGNCISQIIGNLVLSGIDHKMKEQYGVKGYHRHCDDIVMLGKDKEETAYYLNRLDYECNRIGLCVKASSFVAPLKDENINVPGRPIDYLGYVFSRCNMRMRKRTKVRFARKLKKVKSRKRRQEICAAYFGIAKWGKCKTVWKKILQSSKMSFKSYGIKTEIISDLNGKRIFDVQEKKISLLANCRAKIYVCDFEDNLTIKDKGDKCSVLFKEDETSEDYFKFITSSSRIISKLRRARELENGGTKIFPCETFVYEVRLNGGRYTYDID